MTTTIGIVGVAGVGRTHLARVRKHPGATLVGLADIVPETRERAAAEWETLFRTAVTGAIPLQVRSRNQEPHRL